MPTLYVECHFSYLLDLGAMPHASPQRHIQPTKAVLSISEYLHAFLSKGSHECKITVQEVSGAGVAEWKRNLRISVCVMFVRGCGEGNEML